MRSVTARRLAEAGLADLTRPLLVALVAPTLALGAIAAPIDAEVEVRSAPVAVATISASDAGLIMAGVRIAQAGSTGGTLGKPEQSLSGGTAAKEKPPKGGGSRPIGAAAGPKTFHNPTVDGKRIDWCLNDGLQGCGDPSATAWCRSKGLSRATQFKFESGVPSAYRLGDRTVCTAPICGALTEVVCE